MPGDNYSDFPIYVKTTGSLCAIQRCDQITWKFKKVGPLGVKIATADSSSSLTGPHQCSVGLATSTEPKAPSGLTNLGVLNSCRFRKSSKIVSYAFMVFWPSAFKCLCSTIAFAVQNDHESDHAKSTAKIVKIRILQKLPTTCVVISTLIIISQSDSSTSSCCKITMQK